MGKDKNILGIGKFELGAPGDGVMGLTLTEFTDIEVNSLNIEGQQVAEENIPTEGNDTYITVDGESTPAKMTVRLFGVDLADYPLLMGGSFATGKWDAPIKKTSIYLSVNLESKPLSGVKRVVQFPYAKANAKIQGNVTKNGLPAIDVELTANTPVTTLGVSAAPYTIADV